MGWVPLYGSLYHGVNKIDTTSTGFDGLKQVRRNARRRCFHGQEANHVHQYTQAATVCLKDRPCLSEIIIGLSCQLALHICPVFMELSWTRSEPCR